MKKQFIEELLTEYNQNKGFGRKLFGNDPHIKELELIHEIDLQNLSPDEDIHNPELRIIYDTIHHRLEWIQQKSTRSYAENHRLTNHIYHKLIFELAQNYYDAKLAKHQQLIAEKSLISPELILESANFLLSCFYYICFWVKPTPPPSDPSPIIDISEITLNEEENPNVIHDFEYRYVLGQANTDRLMMDSLEDLNPSLLALTESGELIFANDVTTLMEPQGILLNPELRSDTGPSPLSNAEIRNICTTKPEFFKEIKREQLKEQEKFLNNQNAVITERMLDTIHRFGAILRADLSADIGISHETLVELRAYLDSLPLKSKTYLYSHLPMQNIEKGGVCRHLLGMDIHHKVENIRRSGIVIGTNVETLEEKLGISQYDLESKQQINGLT